MSIHEKFKSGNSVDVQQATITRAEYEEYCQLERDLAEAVATLRAARLLVSDWGAYAADYFQKKHDLQGDIDSITAVIKKLNGARVSS